MITEHFILAQSSSIDRETNAVSIFNILEDLNIQAVGKNVHLPLQAFVCTRREGETGPIESRYWVKIVDPSNTEILVQELTLKMNENHRRIRTRINLTLPISATGPYKVMIVSSAYPGMNREFCFFVNVTQKAPTQGSSIPVQ